MTDFTIWSKVWNSIYPLNLSSKHPFYITYVKKIARMCRFIYRIKRYYKKGNYGIENNNLNKDKK